MLRRALTLLLPFCVIGLLFSSCDRKKTENVSGTLLNMPKRAEGAAQQADLVALRSTIQAYRTANGGYPKELKDVAPLLGSQLDLSKFEYDPATGTVRLKNGN